MRYGVVSVRALPGERLDKPGVEVPPGPSWMAAEDGALASLERTTAARLDAFRAEHPADAREPGHDGSTFASAAADFKAALPPRAHFVTFPVDSRIWAIGGSAQRSVVATRNPMTSLLVSANSQWRTAERTRTVASSHEPPRSMRRRQSPPRTHTLPSEGAPS